MDEDEEDDGLSLKSGGKDNKVILCSLCSAPKDSGRVVMVEAFASLSVSQSDTDLIFVNSSLLIF